MEELQCESWKWRNHEGSSPQEGFDQSHGASAAKLVASRTTQGPGVLISTHAGEDRYILAPGIRGERSLRGIWENVSFWMSSCHLPGGLPRPRPLSPNALSLPWHIQAACQFLLDIPWWFGRLAPRPSLVHHKLSVLSHEVPGYLHRGRRSRPPAAICANSSTAWRGLGGDLEGAG